MRRLIWIALPLVLGLLLFAGTSSLHFPLGAEARSRPKPTPTPTATPTQPTPPPCPSPVPASVAAPPPRIGAALAYDGVSGSLLLFSGVRGDGTSQACATWVFDDTWTWDGHRWTQLHPASPPGRSFGSLTFDESTRQTVLFGGGAANSDPARTDTWTWDGTTWTERRPPISPPRQEQASVAYDVARQSVVLLGAFGSSSQTWTWN